MKIIAGLGNPGFRYRNTRHNIGFTIIDLLAKKSRIRLKKKGFSGIYGIGRICGEEIMLFKPMTYMNLSGEAIGPVCSSKLIDKNDLLVISDDFNLSLGDIKLREKGSAGGHNGLRSIIEKIGDDFARLRIGVAGGELPQDVVSYVLTSFPKNEKALIKDVIEKAVECVETWLTSGAKETMSLYNKNNNTPKG